MDTNFSLSDVKHVKKVTVGSADPNRHLSEAERDRQIETLNRYLSGFPKGRIIGKDVDFGIYSVGEHQVVMQTTTYHIGFLRAFDDDAPASKEMNHAD